MRGIDFERAVNSGPIVMLAVALLVLTSCSLRGAKAPAPVTPAAPKPVVTAPPPPPQPLSLPQTRVDLPEVQPVDPAALVTETTTQETPPATRPAAPPRRAPAPAPVATPPAAPPPAAQTNEPPRGAIQEVISATETKRLQDQAQGRRREVNQILETLAKRGLARNQANTVSTIRNFLTLSEDAEKRNDLRQADALAERAQILARDLQNGK